MSLTYGFYNSVNRDRVYHAEQFSSIFDGIIQDGVFSSIGDAMAVTAAGGLTITVGTGRAWFNHTWTLNDDILPIVADEAERLLNRIDAVVLEINANEGVRANAIKIVKGAPASEPQKPELTNDGLVHQHPLCYIYRAANSTEITQSNITNAVGTTECPFVSGILSVVTIDAFIAQWGAQFKEWFEGVQSQLTDDVAGNLLKTIDDHKTDATNPHKVTYDQIKAASYLSTTWQELEYLSGIKSNVQNQLNGKAASSHGTHVTYATTPPVMDGTASAGSASSVARSDHKHPTDTSRAPAYSYGTEDLVAGSSALETGKLYFVYE